MLDAAELKLRAERRLGELLAEMPGHGSHGGNRKSSNTVLLDDIGVGRMDSSRWQKIAGIGEEVFEEHIALARQEGELTTARALRLGKLRGRDLSEIAAMREGGSAVALLIVGARTLEQCDTIQWWCGIARRYRQNGREKNFAMMVTPTASIGDSYSQLREIIILNMGKLVPITWAKWTVLTRHFATLFYA